MTAYRADRAPAARAEVRAAWTRPARWTVAAGVAIFAWVRLESTQHFGPFFAYYVRAYAGAGLTYCAITCFGANGGLGGLVGQVRAVSHVGRHNADDDDRWAVGLTLLLLGIITFAVSIVLAAPDTRAGSTRSAKAHQFAALIGLDDGTVLHPVAEWCARAAHAASRDQDQPSRRS